MLGNDFLIGKRNILKRVGDTVVTTSLQKKKNRENKWQLKSERQKVICTRKEDKETQEKWKVENNNSASCKYRDQILWSTSWQIQTLMNAFTF